jgi:hypothetical protein
MTNGYCTFSLSANGVGGEGRGEVVLISIEKYNPLTLSLSPLGRGEGNFHQVHKPAEIERQHAEEKSNCFANQSNRDWFPPAGFKPSFL